MSDDIVRLASSVADRYQIDREIGRGGMATVYLARDIRHNRKVALKVLNPELGAVLGVERFLAEIRVTANLQHPNLLPLFDSGEVNGLLYYVMPFIDGETLRTRLEREKQLPVDEVVRMSSAIASALGYAHRHDVIHRDLKPENILLHEGQPLIADFGIALAVSNAGGNRITQTGLSLGTPQYMSPEQATGDRVVDARTDIYSLGAMTYEMLVGDPPHVGSTAQAVIAKLLTERPASVRATRPSVPVHVDATVGRALEKLAADRFSTAKEFADSLEGKSPVAASTAYLPAATGYRAHGALRIREIVAWSVAGVLAVFAGWQLVRPKPIDESSVIRANFDLPPGMRINDAVTGTTIAVSPKGDMIAFTTTGGAAYHLYVRRFDELNAREIANTAARNLVFSPDGRWVAFTEGNVIKKASVDGGQLTTLGTTGSAVPYGLTWGKAGYLYIGSFSGMSRIPGTGGTATFVGTQDKNLERTGRRWPLLMPDEKAIIFSGGSTTSAPPKLGVITLDDGKVTAFDLLVATALGVIDGQLVYVSPTGGLMAVPFDLSSRRPTGDPVQLDEGVLLEWQAGSKASLSPSGTLAYLRGRAEYQPMLLDPESTTGVALIKEPGIYTTPRFSPDGGRIAMTVFSSNATDVWVYSIARNTFTRLTTEGSNFRPEWSPDGRDVIFLSVRDGKTGIFRQPADGSGPAQLLYQPEVEPFEALVSPDNKWLIFRTAPGAKYSRDILMVPMTGEKNVTVLVSGSETENMPRVSPDGKWLMYQSNESGRFDVYVRPFPENGARIQVSDNGGTEPLWGRSGKTLYYRDPMGQLVEVAISSAGGISIGARRVVLTGDYLTDASHADYDVAPNGKFLMLKRAGEGSQTIVVHNWARELREKTRAR
jgi:eukaryotic-like serine/threonine-protein kinase